MTPSQAPASPEKATLPSGTVGPQDDLADSADARTAQFTLISILLGLILAALVVGLPHGANIFALNPFAVGAGLAVRVLVVVLIAALVWLEYTWATLTRLMVASPAHNLCYFAVAITSCGAALSVTDFSAWIAWIAALAITAILAVTITSPARRMKARGREYPVELRLLDMKEGSVYISVLLGAASLAILEHARTHWIQTPGVETWCSVGVLGAVVFDLVFQVKCYIPKLRELAQAGQIP